MMKSKISQFFTLFTIGCALAVPVAEASLNDFVANLEADLDGRCTGHAYVVFEDGVLAAAGSGGVRVVDDNIFINSYPFNIHTRKGCHSMSKTITAAAILDALQEKGFDIDRKISADFPDEFRDQISDNRIHLVTYRDLLRHESGWPEERSFKASWNDVKEMISDGLEAPPPALELGISNGYSNRTYGLLRILLSTLLRPEDYKNPFPLFIPYFPSFSSSHYVSRVRQRLLLPAGVLGAATGPTDDPETNPDYNFSKYHYFLNPSVEPRIMKGYRHHVGGFGWTMSTLEFGLFISKLFNEALIAGSCVNTMKSDRLGMGFHSATNSFGHTGSNTLSNSVAGRCGWVHFEDENIQVVVQVNSSHNWYRATGQNINAIIREAYENAYQSPKATEYEYPLNVLFRRKQDGFVVSRGVKNSGSFGRRNFDRDWMSGWTHFRTFEAGGQFYALNYKADLGNGFGRGHMREVNPDGTLGDTVFNQENWRAGWTHIEFFERLGTNYLLLFNETDRRLRVFQMNNNGTLQIPAVVNTTEAAYDILKVVEVAGQDKLFRHNSSTGETVLHPFNPDGSISTPANYMGRWETGFNDFQFYRSDGKLFLCRYAYGDGKVRINELIGAQFQSRPERYRASDWSSGWGIFRFFTIQGKTFNYRYHPEKGMARLQAMKEDGTFDFDSEFQETDELLRAIAPQGEFHPGFTGWTEIEFYKSTTTPATVPPIISLAPGDSNGDERDNKGAGIAHARYFRPTSARIIEPKIQIDLAPTSLNLDWMGLPETIDLAEVSTNLLDWRRHSFHVNTATASTPNLVEIPRTRDEEAGEFLFTRVRRFGLPEPDEPEIGPFNNGPRLH